MTQPRIPWPFLLWIGIALWEGACAEANSHTDLTPAASTAKPMKAPLQLQPMRGPFPTLRAFCQANKSAPKFCNVEAPDKEGNGFTALTGVRAPYQAARLISLGSDVAVGRFYLGIQVSKGWYVQEIAETGWEAQTRELMLDESAPTLGPLIRLRLVGTGLMPPSPGSENAVQMCFEEMLLCGVGKSGTPHCLPPLMSAGAWCKNYSGQPPMPPWNWEIKATLQKDGHLELTGTGQLDFLAPSKHLGTQLLRFP